MGRMSDDRSAPGLLRSVGLLPDGPVVWGRPVPAPRGGVFIVELPNPPARAPVSITRVGKWIERVDSLRLDGERPTSKQLAARLGSFWIPNQPVLYIGATDVSVARRVLALATTVLGDRRPHSGGHWLRTLEGLESARIWWARTDASEEYEDALLTAFAAGVGPEDRAALPDAEVILPFANLRTPTGARKRTGLTAALIVEPAEAPAPTRRVVAVPDGAAEGADGQPAPKNRRAAGSAARAGAGTAPRTAATRSPAPARLSAAAIRAQGRPAEPVHLTPEGADRLRAELDELVGVRRPEVIGRIRTAKELGDLKENADYTSAREEQSFLEGRIQAIEAQLRDAVVIEPPAAGSRIGLGSTVTVEAHGTTTTYSIVGTTEADPAQGRISTSSPVGRALVGHSAGDEVVIRTPNGEVRYRVVDIA
jgi:transcription elongation factor GreA